ncbi:MAG: histidinol-phosphatase HisJ family protein [Candidatus Izimaplasma sp.]|nr:histidinol-phosphatase HisJ family protein [Candidatus Izimaplasma bacterium]
MIDFKKDNHIHTHFSPDADPAATFEGYIVEAQKKGLDEITFTDHVDFDAKHPLFHEMIDYDAYVIAFEKVKKASPIPIRLGVEIGYQAHMKNEINQFIEQYPFDFVILSIHYLEEKDLYTQEYFLNKTKQEAYNIYFDTVLDAIKNISQFDVFGHLDYITRYSPFGDYNYNDYKAKIDLILKTLIKRNKGIEINTSGYQKEKRPYPKEVIIKRYLELGGNHVTLGSDSHNMGKLGCCFDKIKPLFKF